MSIIDEKRLIYGTVKTQGQEFYLLEPRPTGRFMWQPEGTIKWLVADVDTNEWLNGDDPIPVYFPSYIIFGSTALVEILPDPSVYKFVRFTVNEDDEIVGVPV